MTHYQKLGVDKNADKHTLLTNLKNKIEQIKQEYGKNSKSTLKQIDDLLDSYNILSNPKTKKEYDRWLSIRTIARKEQLHSQKFNQKVQLYVMMYNPPPFRICNQNGQVIVTGYYIPKEHHGYFAPPIKVKMKRHHPEKEKRY